MGLADADSNAFLVNYRGLSNDCTDGDGLFSSTAISSAAIFGALLITAIDGLAASAGVDIAWNRQRYLELDIEQ